MSDGALNPKLSIIVPVLNEAVSLESVLSKIARLQEFSKEIIVVDGGSKDDTVNISRKYTQQVVLQDGRGKGDAIRTAARVSRGEILLVIDGDGSHRPAEIPNFVAAILDGADIAKGSRFLEGGGTHDMSLIRRGGNRILVWLANVFFKTAFTDLCYGYMAIRREVFNSLSTVEDGFSIDVEIFLKAYKHGFRIVERPSVELRRVHGKSQLRIFPDGFRILYVILKEYFR